MSLLSDIKKDIQAHNLSGSGSFIHVIAHILLHPSIRMLFSYRLQRRFKGKDFFSRLFRRMLWMGNCRKSGCHINPDADIAAGVHFAHPTGVVIGKDTIVEEGVVMYQHVTLGGKNFGDQGKCPVVKKNTIIYAGAVIVGEITVGENVTIGANTVIRKDVPDNLVVSGNPAEIIAKKTQ